MSGSIEVTWAEVFIELYQQFGREDRNSRNSQRAGAGDRLRPVVAAEADSEVGLEIDVKYEPTEEAEGQIIRVSRTTQAQNSECIPVCSESANVHGAAQFVSRMKDFGHCTDALCGTRF